MPVIEEQALSLAELGRILEDVDKAAFLVAPRLLRRIIKYDRKLTHLGLQVPHRKSYVIGREALLERVTRAELEIPTNRALPSTLLLLTRPDPEKVAATPRGQTLVKYWRLLFHVRVHQALSDRFKENRVTPAAIRQRIHQIGRTEFDEIRQVLHQEKFLLPPHDDHAVFEEFVAIYLELSYFATPLLPKYFSAIDDFGRIDRILAEDVDAATLFNATRPAGAPNPEFLVDDPDKCDESPPPATETLVWTSSEKVYDDLERRADRATARGNVVRAAIIRTQAARAAAPVNVLEAQDRVLAEVDHLVKRLQRPLWMTDAEAETWRRALPALLPQAATGIWPPEARLLYDLQKICTDHERPFYAPDIVEWVYSFFRQPLLRQLPNQPVVLAVKHLRLALNRLSSSRIADTDRRALSGLLQNALHHAEERLRETFRPPIREALERVGLQPQNFPERLGKDKLIEEILDRIVERGFLNMGDLRDALARNQLKLPDLSEQEFVTGDPLIRANRELAESAAGVYHRGEIYLRWLQRCSALAFGTRPGQSFVLYFALPFLGAFATVVFAQEMLHIFHFFFKKTVVLEGPHHLKLAPLVLPITLLGIFYFLLLHAPRFRYVVMRTVHIGWRVFRAVLFDLPLAFLFLPMVRRFLHSRPFLIFIRYGLKPLPFAALAWLILWAWDLGQQQAWTGAVLTFLLAGLLINSRFGRDVEETLIDGTVRNWEFFRDLLPGIFRMVMSIFKTILEAIDRFFYTVDEWLRFRGGQGKLILTVKTVLGFLWFLVTYVVRLYLNVFIEPTFNPIKHFPVVTVAAKLLFPLWPVLWGTPESLGYLGAPFAFLGAWNAWIIGFVLLHSIPGVAGFFVWEFKENWRLYRTNRPATLQPEVVGHHGETMTRLLRPGIHSGTLPKLHAKIRVAERKANRGGTWTTVRRLRTQLHQVEESIRHFTQRELLAFLNAGKGWTGGPVKLIRVDAGSNRIRLELNGLSEKRASEPLELCFEEQAGWLLAKVAQKGWLASLPGPQVDVFITALLGFYQKAGVDLVREQIEACLGNPCPPYDIDDEGLIVWPGHGYETEVVYNLDDEPLIHPHLKEGHLAESLPILVADKLLLKNQPIDWNAWVDAWSQDQTGEGSPQGVLPKVHVLPGF